MITLDDLKKMKPGVFAKGMFLDAPGAVNIANTGNMCKWVAVRGIIHDWEIYSDNPHSPQPDFEMVASMGDKIHNREYVKMLVDCDEESLAMYRD